MAGRSSVQVAREACPHRCHRAVRVGRSSARGVNVGAGGEYERRSYPGTLMRCNAVASPAHGPGSGRHANATGLGTAHGNGPGAVYGAVNSIDGGTSHTSTGSSRRSWGVARCRRCHGCPSRAGGTGHRPGAAAAGRPRPPRCALRRVAGRDRRWAGQGRRHRRRRCRRRGHACRSAPATAATYRTRSPWRGRAWRRAAVVHQ